MALGALTTSALISTASAVRYTIDFKDKKGGGHIEASDLADFRDLINVLGPKKSLEDQKKYEFKFLIALGTKIPGTGLRFEHIVESGDNSKVTIVLKDGILEDQEAKKLLDGVKMSFNIEFINCSGTLDLNEDLKEHAETIHFKKCDFKTVANCFENAKLLQFIDTKITPEDGRLGILKPTKVQVGGTNTVLRPLKDVVILERNGETLCNSENKPEKKTEEVAAENIELKKRYEKLKKLSEEAVQNNENLRKEIQNLQKQMKTLEEDHKKKVENMQRSWEKAQSKNKRIQRINKLEEENNKLKKSNNELEKRIDELQVYLQNIKKTVALVVKKNEESKALEDKQREMESKILDLERRNSDLERRNSDLERKNSVLEERILDLTSNNNPAPVLGDDADAGN